MNDLPDRDQDGIPDVIEDSLEEARSIKRFFGTKGLIIIGLIFLNFCAIGGLAYYAAEKTEDYNQLKQQFDWAQTEHEIEMNAAIQAERAKILKEMEQEAKLLDKDRKKKQEARKQAQHELQAKPYARRNEYEADKMDLDDLRSGFGDLGYPAKPSTSE